MSTTKIPFILFLALIMWSTIIIRNTCEGMHQPNTLWTQHLLQYGRFLKHLMNDCSSVQNKELKINENDENYYHHYHLNPTVMECLKRKSLLALGRALDADVIPIYEDIELVRYNGREAVDLSENTTKSRLQNEMQSDWKETVRKKLVDLFRTHVVKIHLESDLNEFRSNDDGRRRRHRNSMMPIFLFGTLAMAMVLVPMGFKFLAVLGGKALLLAKMALLLASIQGLKRIATSNLNYGLYHVPNAGWNDRHSRLEYLNSAPYIYDSDTLGQPPDVQMAIG